jgi:hypothetical protein
MKTPPPISSRPIRRELDAEFARLKPEEAASGFGNYKLLQQMGEGGFGVVWMRSRRSPFGGGWR